MPEIEVRVLKGGREICRVVRPLHTAGEIRFVTYKRRHYQVRRGNLIDLDKGCLEAEPSAAAAPAAVTPSASAAVVIPTPGDLSSEHPRPTHRETGSTSSVGRNVDTESSRSGRAAVAGGPSVSHATDDLQDREAIRSAGAGVRMLVEAGPGTGKTEMAALRLAGLIRLQLSPGQILVLSFSRSAVRTLTRRLVRVAGPDDRVMEELRHVSIRTFDSWAFRLLRLLGRPPAALLARAHDENISELTSLMSGRYRDEVRSLIGDRRHLIVDEFQDLPGVRGELVLALLDLLAPPGRPGCGFTILGDPAQAIYGFATRSGTGTSFPSPAAYWRRVIDTYKAELDVRTLRRNFRTGPSLAALSADLRGVLLSSRPDEEKLRIIRDAIAVLPAPAQPPGPDWLRSGETGSRAILTRTNGAALRVMQKLLGTDVEGPPTTLRLRAGSYAPLPPAWIAALLRRLRSPGLTRSQFRKIFTHLAKQWDEATRQRLGLPPEDVAWVRLARASGAAEDSSALQVPDLRMRLNWPDAFPDDQPVSDEDVIVTTIHQSKGMEFDVVTVLDTGRDEDGDDGNEDGLEEQSAAEEASVGYVAITRAGRALTRIDRDGLFQALHSREFQNNRRRLCCWRGGWVNLEMGLRGDIDPFGFVDPALHGGAAGVEALQEFLLSNARRLEGHKVMLCKHAEDGKVTWRVHLQNGRSPDRVIGRTAPQLTFDLLHLLNGKGISLPRTIMNLRIAAVGTVTSDAEFPLEEPARSSRLWLGVSLFGTGDFQTPKKRS